MNWSLPRVLRSRTKVNPREATAHEEATARKLAELTRSRRNVAEAYERERRRIERDLHDGAQQYFVAATMALGEAQLHADLATAQAIARAQELLDRGLDSLRTTVRGIHPAELREFGLVAAVDHAAAAYGSHITVRSPHPLPKLSESVLAAAYFFSTEALTNAAKYAPGASVSVLITADTHLRVSIADTGPGGAHMQKHGGLAQMHDRLAAFDGSMELSSPPGGPTRVVASIPLLLNRGESGIGEAQ